MSSCYNWQLKDNLQGSQLNQDTGMDGIMLILRNKKIYETFNEGNVFYNV